MPEQKEQPIHTLLSREIRPLVVWREWLEHWQEAKNLQAMESLLHCGFNVIMDEASWNGSHLERIFYEKDRIIFYLTIAHGWSYPWSLELPGDERYDVGIDSSGNKIQKRAYELRNQLARKAFDMLCINYFKNMVMQFDRTDAPGFGWDRMVFSNEIFPAIQTFFKVQKQKNGDTIVLNLPPQSHHPLFDRQNSHHEVLIISFLMRLVSYIWNWKEDRFISYKINKAEIAVEKAAYEKNMSEKRNVIHAAMPWLIEILSHLNKLDVLQKWILEFDKPSLAKLKEIALRNRVRLHELFGTEEHIMQNLDEARYFGSAAAWLLSRHELMIRESKRLKGIRAAEELKSKAGDKIRELSGKK